MNLFVDLLRFVSTSLSSKGGSIAIDLLCMLFLLIITVYSFRFYRLEKEVKNNGIHRWLSLGFLLLGLSFMIKAALNALIGYTNLEYSMPTAIMGSSSNVFTLFTADNWGFYVGFMLSRLITLLGLYILYSVYYQPKQTNRIFMLYFIIIITFFSFIEPFIFDLTFFIFLLLITIASYKNMKKHGRFSTRIVALSFSLVALSSFIFWLSGAHHAYYLLAEIIQVAGFGALLLAFLVMKKYDAKSNKG